MVGDVVGMAKTLQKVEYKRIFFEDKEGKLRPTMVRSVSREVTEIFDGEKYVPVAKGEMKDKNLRKKFPGVQPRKKKRHCPWLD